MFWRLIREPFRRPGTRRRAVWAVVAIASGTAVAAAMLSVSLEIGDRIGNELRSLGANMVITPAADSLPIEIGDTDLRPVSEGAFIAASSLPLLKTIFWRNNILSFAPYLFVPAEISAARINASGQSDDLSTVLVGTWFSYPVIDNDEEQFRTGVQSLNPTWQVEGDWVDDTGGPAGTAQALMGSSLARAMRVQPGDTVQVSVQPATGSADTGARLSLEIKGILTTGGPEEDQIIAPLDIVQSATGMDGQVRRVQVSALIKPEDELSRRDPETMSPADYDRWYCSPYISSILHQIGEVMPGTSGRVIREVAETQGAVLGKLTFLMLLLSILALVAAAFSISSLGNLNVLERRQEIALMKAVGGQNALVASFLMVEMALQGLIGGLFGFAGGQFLARVLGQTVFGAVVELNWFVLPAILVVSLIVSLGGTWLPIRRAVRQAPAPILRGE